MNASGINNIYSYLDYRKFLMDYYSSRKVREKDFSYTVWANEAGLTSRSYIRLVVSGKRNITLSYLEMLLMTLKLNKKETAFFKALVLFNQSTNLEEREFHWKEVIRNMDVKASNHQIDTYKFLSSHWCPKILSVVTLSDIDRSLKGLAQILDLSEKEVKSHLEILETLGMLYEQDEQWLSTQTSYTVNSEYNNLALQSFHKNSLLQAIDKIELDSRERFFNSLLLSLSEDQTLL